LSIDPAKTLCITLDVDWAVEEVLDSVVGTLREAGLPATFFATHSSKVLERAEGDQFEIGLHPNFNDSRGEFEEPIATLKRAYPDAVGGRSHSLFVSSNILELYIRHGLTYESNIFLLDQPGLMPVLRFEKLVSLPFNWSDDKHFELGRPFRSEAVGLGSNGLKVINFHPIHVFMNTRDLAHYDEYRQDQQDLNALERFANRDGIGVGTLFEEVIGEVSRRRLPTARMCDVAADFFARSG
jgi:hypothetical protein